MPPGTTVGVGGANPFIATHPFDAAPSRRNGAVTKGAALFAAAIGTKPGGGQRTASALR
jgi:hypothetical protein